MSKRFLYIHFGFAFLTLLAIGVELVHFLIVYPDMPETIGMHFGGDGEFDVHAEKLYGLYPYVMGGFLIGMLLLADRFVLKLKLGLDYDKKGEELVRAAVLLATNGAKAYICLFFLEWSDAVIHQHGTKGRINTLGAIVFLVFFISALALGSYAKRKYKHKNAEPAKRTDIHRLVKLYGVVMSICEIIVAIVVWERFPEQNETTDPFALIWYEDIKTNAPKFLYLVPIVLSFASVFIFDIIVKRLTAKGRLLPARACDIVSAYCVTCAFLRLLLPPEEFFLDGLGAMALCFAPVGLVELIKYLRGKRIER